MIVRSEGFPKFYLLYPDEGVLRDSDNMIVTKEEYLDLIKQTFEFYINSDPKSIEKINAELKEEYRKEYFGQLEKTNKDETKPSVGFVYLIQADGEHYKIGSTINLATRMKSLQTSSPNDIELIYSTKAENYMDLEFNIHAELTKLGKHVRGEWFDLDAKDLKYVRGIFDTHDINKGSD